MPRRDCTEKLEANKSGGEWGGRRQRNGKRRGSCHGTCRAHSLALVASHLIVVPLHSADFIVYDKIILKGINSKNGAMKSNE